MIFTQDLIFMIIFYTMCIIYLAIILIIVLRYMVFPKPVLSLQRNMTLKEQEIV
jgi:hypothetical protein